MPPDASSVIVSTCEPGPQPIQCTASGQTPAPSSGGQAAGLQIPHDTPASDISRNILAHRPYVARWRGGFIEHDVARSRHNVRCPAVGRHHCPVRIGRVCCGRHPRVGPYRSRTRRARRSDGEHNAPNAACCGEVEDEHTSAPMTMRSYRWKSAVVIARRG